MSTSELLRLSHDMERNPVLKSDLDAAIAKVDGIPGVIDAVRALGYDITLSDLQPSARIGGRGLWRFDG